MKIKEQKPKCTDCPEHKVIIDPDPYDWFCDDDEAIVCTLTTNPRLEPESKFAHRRSPQGHLLCYSAV
jgi:hypothetical protein